MITLHTVFAPALLHTEYALQHAVVVVIDVLRATTTICQALHAGAREVIPVAELEQALRLAERLDKDVVLLGGERQGVKPTGFHLGNSPGEYTAEIVRGKVVILTTTNGTRALAKTKHAAHQVVGSFLNVQALAEYIAIWLAKPENEPRKVDAVYMLCAGTNGDFCYEDALCAGALAQKVFNVLPEVALSDSTQAAVDMFTMHEQHLEEFIAATHHARFLASIGFGDDIAAGLRLNACPVVPVMQPNGALFPSGVVF